MEENIQKFTERLRELVAQGKKKKSILEIQEINDFFADMELEAEQMEKVFEYLEANNIDVLRISSDDDLDVDMDVIMAEEADDVDMENIDLSVPDGVSIEDRSSLLASETRVKEPVTRAWDAMIAAAVPSITPTGRISSGSISKNGFISGIASRLSPVRFESIQAPCPR